MEMVVLEEKPNSMTFELKGEQHTFPNLFCWALSKDSKVTLAVYNPGHPLVGSPKIHVETNGKSPRKAMEDATKLLENEMNSFKRAIGQA